jgi:hypothetical protein
MGVLKEDVFTLMVINEKDIRQNFWRNSHLILQVHAFSP